jgi:hypothetical protein
LSPDCLPLFSTGCFHHLAWSMLASQHPHWFLSSLHNFRTSLWRIQRLFKFKQFFGHLFFNFQYTYFALFKLSFPCTPSMNYVFVS